MTPIRIIKIFLASSSDLKEDRDQFRLFISQENERRQSQGIYLEIVQWENSLDAISDTQLQVEFNKAISECDFVIFLFFTKVGKYTAEEFDMAFQVFKNKGKPKIWTYFKNAPLNSGLITEEFNTLIQFKKKLESLGHFYTEYTNVENLIYKYKTQLDLYLLQFENSSETGDIDTKSAAAAADKEPIKNILNYWLLKMNPETWNIERLEIGQNTFFSPYYLNQERPEFLLFEKINKGDQVLGFALGNYQGIVCIMEVTDPIGPDEKQGVVFKMVVKRIIKPEIPFQKIKNLIDTDTALKLSESKTPPELFFLLTTEQFQNFLDTKNTDSEEGKIYQPFFVTEGNHKKTEDKLDFEKDYDSFASVIALEKVNPPLAIGLFGNWGSGKSFFMEKLAERIEFYAKSNDEKYIKDVVQVIFNSWHYSDANLWASLITEIFDSLKIYAKKQNQESEINKLQRTLKTTILEQKVIDEKRKKLETSVKELELEQIQKRSKLEDISGIKLLKQILSDKRINKDLSELNNENIEQVIENKNNIDQYITEIQDTRNKTIFFFKELFNLRGWRWVIVILIALIALIGAPFLNSFFPDVWEKITWQVRVYTSAIVAFLVNFIATIKPYTTAIRDALNRLQSLKETMDSREQVENPKLTVEQSELNELQSSLFDLDTKITDTKENINDILSGRQLIKFIDERIKDESYSNALGVISWVRKDFITLDKLLREQHSISKEEKNELFNPEDVQLKIDRIILYIDDLDRCNEDVVVKVLEAIHLLLAFPLFVVVVGVDPRWLNNALSEKYKNLFGNIGKNNSKTDGSNESEINQPAKEDSLLLGAATSYDYLEKIFQIPFALKPIDKTGRENLIQYLMKDEMEMNKEAETIEKRASNLEKSNNEESESMHGGLENGSDEKSNSKEVLSSGSVEKDKQTITKKTKERLLFTTDELVYMQKISSIFGQTPRTINRYVNIYRIIKAHENLKVVGKYSKEEFIPIMFLLGIIVGYAAVAEYFMEELSVTKNADKFNDFINKSVLPENFKKVISPFISDFETLTIEDFKRNKELISRFSFRQLMK